MSSESKIEVADEPNIREELWEKVPYVYVNATQTQGSNWDLRILFSERLPKGSVEPRVAVVMSPQHAKAFLEALTTTVNGLENLIGPIKYQPAKKVPTPTED